MTADGDVADRPGTARRDGPGPLGANRDFRLLWAGQSASRVGTAVTELAVPLIAVVTLHGGPVRVAALTAFEFLPSLLLGLVAGVLVDRADGRRLLVSTDFGRCALLAVLPLAAWLGWLSFGLLYLVVFGVGVLTLLYDLAYQSMLPRILAPADLVGANGRLETSRAVAAGVGPLAGGALVQGLTAPFAVAVDAVTFAVSGVCALAMSATPRPGPARRRFRAELAEGLRAVLRDPVQLRLTATALTSNFFGAAIQALLVLYAVRELRLSALAIGVAFASGALGAVAGAALLGPLRRFSPPAAMLLGLVGAALGYLVVPAAGRVPWPLAVALLGTAYFLGQAGIVVLAARAMAWRQLITPIGVLGRVISVTRTLAFGVLPLGALLAGVLAGSAGVRAALAAGAVGMLAAGLWLIGPVRAGGARVPA